MPMPGREATPPPTIGKIGPYTVFVTPTTPRSPTNQPAAGTPSTPPVVVVQAPPPSPMVQPPPHQFYKVSSDPSDGTVSGFFKNAVVKVQNAHSSLDEHVAHWFGLNQSKYQWALDDYYETKGGVRAMHTACLHFDVCFTRFVILETASLETGDQLEAKAAKDISRKAQNV